MRRLRADLILAGRQTGHVELARQLAHPRRRGVRGRARSIQLRLRDAAGFELRFVPRPVGLGPPGLGLRLGELRANDV